MPRTVDPRFPEQLRKLLDERGMSYRTLAAVTFYSKSHLHDLATGRKQPTPEAARRIDDALTAAGHLAELARPPAPLGDEVEALELARRVAASDISPDTLDRIETAVDDLAVAYAHRPAQDLAPLIARHLGYVNDLVGARKTLDQQRRLIVAGGWLALLAATVHIDLQSHRLPGGYLDLAWQLAHQAEHAELTAWIFETRAWNALTDHDFRRAVDLSRQAQDAAPRGSSAYIQATAQEGRAWARMGRPAETRDALARTAKLVSPLEPPERPEHHYRYDPGKAIAYTATTLSWVRDPAAEDYARDVVAHLGDPPAGEPRPRRMAIAQLDLALALLGAQKVDEAAVVATSAIGSGRFVGSNWWRATEVVLGIERSGVVEAADLREVYEAHRPVGSK